MKKGLLVPFDLLVLLLPTDAKVTASLADEKDKADFKGYIGLSIIYLPQQPVKSALLITLFTHKI
jgi:hypothetical protein